MGFEDNSGDDISNMVDLVRFEDNHNDDDISNIVDLVSEW